MQLLHVEVHLVLPLVLVHMAVLTLVQYVVALVVVHITHGGTCGSYDETQGATGH